MAFHPYTQLIPEIFNLHEFGPPRGFTRASTWPCVDHLASGYNDTRLVAHFGLAFAPAPPIGLSLATYIKSPNHDAKGTPSGIPLARRSPRTACRHAVSGSFDSPHRGSFHLSLAVLVHYRSPGVFSLTRWSSADSDRIARVPPYLGTPLRRYGSISRTGLSRSLVRLSRRFTLTSLFSRVLPMTTRNPECHLRDTGLGCSAFRSPLLRESLIVFFSSGY